MRFIPPRNWFRCIAEMPKPRLISVTIRAIVLRLLPKIVRVGEIQLAINPREHIMSGLLALGFYENFERLVFDRVLKPGMVVLDIGANVGLYTALAAARVGEEGAVFAFEPEPKNHSLLQETIRLNGFRNVHAHEVAVSDVPGTVKLYLSDENMGDHRIYGEDTGREAVEVPMVVLDDFLASCGSRKVDVVKMDIQGAEEKAIAGMERILAENAELSILTEFWPWGVRRCGGDPSRLLRKFRELGFDVYQLDERAERMWPVSDDSKLLAMDSEEQAANLYLQRGPLKNGLRELRG